MASICAFENSDGAAASCFFAISAFAFDSSNASSICFLNCTVLKVFASSPFALFLACIKSSYNPAANWTDFIISPCASAVGPTNAHTTVISSIFPPPPPPLPIILFNPPNKPPPPPLGTFTFVPVSLAYFSASKEYGDAYVLSSACALDTRTMSSAHFAIDS